MIEAADTASIYPLIVTPSHDSKFFQNYLMSMLSFSSHAHHRGVRFQVMTHCGESLITRARNTCVAHFLAHPEYTHLFWIDADIGFSVDAAFRLLLSGHDVCAGVYPLKEEFWPAEGLPAGTTRQDFEGLVARYTVNADAAMDGSLDLAVQPDGFIKVSEAPTGFMVVRRSVFERLIEAYPDHGYVSDREDRAVHYRFFDVAVDPVSGRYMSEDYGFCRLWTALGGSIHVDANSSLSHHGYKIYRGSFARSLTTSLGNAVGVAAGTRMRLSGADSISPNAPGLV